MPECVAVARFEKLGYVTMFEHDHNGKITYGPYTRKLKLDFEDINDDTPLDN
jgi:hypothetical protein